MYAAAIEKAVTYSKIDILWLLDAALLKSSLAVVNKLCPTTLGECFYESACSSVTSCDTCHDDSIVAFLQGDVPRSRTMAATKAKTKRQRRASRDPWCPTNESEVLYRFAHLTGFFFVLRHAFLDACH